MVGVQLQLLLLIKNYILTLFKKISKSFPKKKINMEKRYENEDYLFIKNHYLFYIYFSIFLQNISIWNVNKTFNLNNPQKMLFIIT